MAPEGTPRESTVGWYGPIVRWGLSVSVSEELTDPRVVADVAAAAEAAGWDGVFVWDHLWNRTLAPFADPFVTLAAVAAATERVRMGTMVTPLPRRRPQLVAQATNSLDLLSGGRMVLALGLGVDSYGEFSRFDEAADDDRARARVLDAAIPVLDQMLRGGPVDAVDGFTTTAAGAQRPRVPIWIAARAGRSAGPRRVRRHSVEGLALVDPERWAPEHVTAALDAGGLAAGTVDVVLVGGVHPDPDALAAAGATWCLREISPGFTAAEAVALAAAGPGG